MMYSSIIFIADENSPTAKSKCYGIIGGVPVPFPIPDDACANNNLKCPVTSGASAVYTNKIFCSPQYPKVIPLRKHAYAICSEL